MIFKALTGLNQNGVGLGNVDNTSDLDKPISTAQQAEFDRLTSFVAENKDVVTIYPGMVVAPHPSGTGVILAQNPLPARPAIGLSRTTTAPTFSDRFQSDEYLTLADWTAVTGSVSLTALGIYFLSSTPGQLTTTAPTTPGTIVQIVGQVVSPTTLKIELQAPILL